MELKKSKAEDLNKIEKLAQKEKEANKKLTAKLKLLKIKQIVNKDV